MTRTSLWTLVVTVSGTCALVGAIHGCGGDNALSIDSGIGKSGTGGSGGSSGGTGGTQGTGGSGTGGSGSGGAGGSGTGGQGGGQVEKPDAAVSSEPDARRGDRDGGRQGNGDGGRGMIPMCPDSPDGKACDMGVCRSGQQGARLTCYCSNLKWVCPSLHLDGGAVMSCPANPRDMPCATAGEVCRGATDAGGGFGCFCRMMNNQLTWGCFGA